jgi:hypothetical protein
MTDGEGAELVRRRWAFEGCLKFFDGPELLLLPPEGWAHVSEWGPGVPDGFYCEFHADVLERLHMSGEQAQLDRRWRPTSSRRRSRSWRG